MSDVNMLTSLKALLFSSASPSSPTAVAAQPAGRGMDFAALIGVVGEASDATPGMALPLPPAVAANALASVPAPETATQPLGTAEMLDARQARPPLPLTAVPLEGAADVLPTTTIAPAERPMVAPPVTILMAPAEEPVLQAKAPPPKLKGAAQPVPPQAEGVEAKDEPAAHEEAEDSEAVTADTDPAHPPVALAVPAMPPIALPPVAVVRQDQPMSEAPRVTTEPPVSAPSLPPSQTVLETETPPPFSSARAAAGSLPAAVVTPVGQPFVEPPAPAVAVLAASVPPVVGSPADQSAPPIDTSPADTATATPLAVNSKVKPVKSEALSLLQLVREQFAPRSRATVSAEPMARHGKAADRPTESAEAAPMPALTTDLPSTASQPAAARSVPSGPQPTAQPVADLSASLGAQVVDMGVSGQWIDGLARDIAGLSANGAQGRFQINTDQLGPVQVDIRQGHDGAAVSLTVASEAAETALRQDSDRLRLDAGLSAVRIAEVKIERAPHVAEAARSDGANQQNGQQNSSQTANGWANNGQNMAQSQQQSQQQAQGQARWRTQENSAFAAKNSGDPAVLNHDDTGRAGNDPLRARYA